MIAVTAQTRIWVAREPADFRCGIDGLAKVCRSILKADPFSGALFVFRNRRSKSIKILAYNGRGFWLCQKRLSKERFRWWPEGSQGHVDTGSASIATALGRWGPGSGQSRRGVARNSGATLTAAEEACVPE